MNIAIIAMGTRGDIQPYIALGKGLKKAGHTVRLVTHENFELLVISHRLEFWSMKGNVQHIVQSEEMREVLEKGNFLTIISRSAEKLKELAIIWAQEGLVACQGMDLLLAGIGGLYLGITLAEKLNIPLVQAYVVPFTPTKAFPSCLLPNSAPKLGSFVNRLSHDLVRQIMWQGFRSSNSLAREQILNLPKLPFWGPYNLDRLHKYPLLYGFSPSLIPKPSDWGDNIHITGNWFLDSASDWTPSSALIEFLENGTAPLYIGFGSMGSRKPEELAKRDLQALQKTQQRAIIFSGWGGLRKEDLPDTVFIVDSTPHSWLFPRVSAVIHHGGAGTTAAGLRAGVPSLIIPFFGDQLLWGQQVAKLGVGPDPIPRNKLTVESLAQAIQKILGDRQMQQRAADLGAKIRSEDGIGSAVSVIQNI